MVRPPGAEVGMERVVHGLERLGFGPFHPISPDPAAVARGHMEAKAVAFLDRFDREGQQGLVAHGGAS